MNKRFIDHRKIPSRTVVNLIGIPLMLLLIIFMSADNAQAQVDSNYAVSIGTFKALPGDTVLMPIYLRNSIPGNSDAGEVGGFLLRFIYDQQATFPDLLIPIQDYSYVVYDSTVDPPQVVDLQYYMKSGVIGRGMGLWLYESAVDSSLDLFCYNVPISDSLADTMVIRYIPPFIDDTLTQMPHISPSGSDSSIVLQIPFLVNPNAALNDYTQIVFRDDQFNYVDNQLSDTLGTSLIRPITHSNNYFIVGEPDAIDPCDTLDCQYGCTNGVCNPDPDPNNDPPVVTLGGLSSYAIEQGNNVSFNVSASDPDAGNQVCLEATNLPSGATFTPTNPICGTNVTVTGSFSWTPTFGQEGTFAVTFRASDPSNASASQTVAITVDKLDKDRLYSTSNYGFSPVGGLPGANPVAFPVDLASTKTVYGVQFDMTYPSEIAFLDSITVTDRTSDYVIYENISVFPDTIRVVSFGLNNEPIVDGTSTAIFNTWYTLDSAALPGDYWVKFHDAWESVDPDPEVASEFLTVDSGIIQVDILGDVNIDREVNVADLVNIVAYIIGNYDLPKRNFETADVVTDVSVNVVDLVGIVNMIFGLEVDGTSPAPINNDAAPATMKIVHDDLMEGQLTKLNVQGEFPDNIAGVQLQIDYDPKSLSFNRPELPDEVSNYSMAYSDDKDGRMKVVLYSREPWNSSSLISSGESNILHLPANIKQAISASDDSKVRITRAFLSNGDANEIRYDNPTMILPTSFKLKQNYPNPFNPTTEIQFEIGAQDGGAKHVTLDIFNILGQKVTNLVDSYYGNGTYTVEWNSTNNSGEKVATGIYLYKLTVEDASDTRKMVLLK